MNADTVEAGPELDRKLHVFFFGPAPADDSRLPRFSTDITEAQRLSDKLGGIDVRESEGEYVAELEREEGRHQARARSPELAMCRVALKVGESR